MMTTRKYKYDEEPRVPELILEAFEQWASELTSEEDEIVRLRMFSLGAPRPVEAIAELTNLEINVVEEILERGLAKLKAKTDEGK